VTELAVREEEGIFSRLGVERSPTSLTLPPDLAYDDFEEIGHFIGVMHDAANWWLGAWLVQGEMLFGDKVYQAAEITRRSPRTLINVASVYRRVPESCRNPNVKFSLHAEVAALEPREQKRWLKEAEQRQFTKADLRAEIHAEKDGNDPAVLPPAVLSVEEAARAVWFASVRSVGDTFFVPAEPMLALRAALGE
jgi:hypothetical protein